MTMRDTRIMSEILEWQDWEMEHPSHGRCNLHLDTERGMLDGSNIRCKNSISSTYGHSQLKIGHPVRFAIHKQLNGRLVLRWVTTWESLLLYVLRRILLPHT